MNTITIDILNENAIPLLRDLELLKVIRLRRDKGTVGSAINWSKYKGAMGKQSLNNIDDQLDQLRNEWE